MSKKVSAVNRVLADLKKGLTIKTNNASCRKYGTNQVPDVIRKLRRSGVNIETHMIGVKVNGISTRVAQYTLVG